MQVQSPTVKLLRFTMTETAVAHKDNIRRKQEEIRRQECVRQCGGRRSLQAEEQ